MEPGVREEWDRFKRVWVALAFVTPFLPLTVSVFPIFVNSFVASSSKTTFVAILVANFLLNIVLLIPLFSTARRLRRLAESEQLESRAKKDPTVYQAASIVIGSWVVLMTVLAIVGWFFVG